MITDPKNLTLEQAIEYLRQEHERMSELPKEFEGEDPDEMYLAGYMIAIRDLESATRKQ
jgi:hypothetical protein